MTWLITGGAGYIRSHVVDQFLSAGKKVVVFDSLINGLKLRVDFINSMHPENQAVFIEADNRDTDAISETIETYGITGIVHLAALKSVAQSMAEPDLYMEVNYEATKSLLDIAQSHGIKQFIFSSTAAVYQSPDTGSVKESDPTNPISLYGESKLLAEGAINKFLRRPGTCGTSLRFFNVVGTANPALMDNSRENLVPIVINKIEQGQAPVIFGSDYPAPDGTCIRDYVDVRDVARAHLSVADTLLELPCTLNIGTGCGHSVREFIEMVFLIAGHSAMVEEASSRAADSATLIADVALIDKSLNFVAQYSLKDSVGSLFI
jgi:UDP-glucose 4-epimerase